MVNSGGDSNSGIISANKVVTKDYPENIEHGFMVCGINYGYSVADEKRERAGSVGQIEQPSFFSDLSVRKTDKFRNRIIKWLKNWGFDLVTEAGKEGPLERRFFQCNWLDTQARSTEHDEITLDTLVKESDGFLGLLSQRRPSVVFLGGSILMNAVNDKRLLPRIVNILGEASEERIYLGDLPDYRGRRFRVRVRNFRNAVIIGLPHPTGSRGLSDAYMASIKLPIYAVHRMIL